MINSHWLNIFKIHNIDISLIEKEIIDINLNAGDTFYDFKEKPKGIIFINKGSLRLIGKDENNELITINKYKKNDIACAIPIILETLDTSLIASTDVSGLFLKKEIFEILYTKSNKFSNLFNQISKEEYYFLAISNPNPRLFESNKLLKWSELQFQKKKEVLLIKGSSKKLPNPNRKYLVSCRNLQNKNFGEILTSKDNIESNGSLPVRLVPIPEDWPPIHKEIIEKDIENKSSNSEESNRNSFLINEPFEKIKSLEDLYGKIDSENSFPFEKGVGPSGESLACFRMISLYFDIPFRRDFIKKIIEEQINRSENKDINLFNLAAIADLIGLKTSVIKPIKEEFITRVPTPSILLVEKSPLICWEINKNGFIVSDPKSKKKLLSIDDLKVKINFDETNFLYLEKTNLTPKSRFGLSWFLPSIKKYKNSLIQVVIASFFVQLLALFNPLLIQQIIDTVITQGSLRSLNVLGLLLIIMSISQAVLSSLRTFLFSDTTNKIDASLGSSIVNHLFRLPLQYFSKRSIGDVSSRVSELETIRNFLTGTALTILLDAVFSLLYIAVMLMYSVKLTIWALSVIPLFILLTLFISPVIKNQLREKAEASAKVNSHLVETISGIETIKAQRMEIASEWKWGKLYSRQIRAGFKNTITSTTASSISNFFQQLSGLIVIWVGASMVLKGQLSIGQLIAFRIISGYVTNPLLRISSIWQNFQEIGVSLNRLSDVVDNLEEIEINGKNLPPLPPIRGKVSYEGLNFSFSNNNKLQLKNINFKINKGDFVGIVGKSGSGKSTLLKILMRFYNQNEGKIKIDDFDVSKVDLYSLRNQIGIVSQESLLFDGTIFSNISIAKPNASLEEVIEASKLSLAHEFIENLPSSYSTTVREKGTELSGGQRQRIAIARMILSDPNLVILDEATSALDIETEKNVVNNLLKKFSSKTIFFISHRLHNLINADEILVIEDGILVEKGKHDELIKLNGKYKNLFKNNEFGN
tara:strand:+ start:146 stop:3100 length:2955 start_codon:yes stop_codon:yes gene_type:complete